MTSNEAISDKDIAALAVLAESAAAADSAMAEEENVHDEMPVAAPADGAATAPIVESIVDGSQEEKEGRDEVVNTAATLMEPTAAANENDDVVMTAAHNDDIINDEADADDTMAESESNAISMASTALLIDLERRYMDMSMDYQKVKAELANAQAKIQQQQQHEPSGDEVVTTLQRTIATKDQQIGQLQSQIQTQEETMRMMQEQKDQLLAKTDTLQEEIRYVRCC